MPVFFWWKETLWNSVNIVPTFPRKDRKQHSWKRRTRQNFIAKRIYHRCLSDSRSNADKRERLPVSRSEYTFSSPSLVPLYSAPRFFIPLLSQVCPDTGNVPKKARETIELASTRLRRVLDIGAPKKSGVTDRGVNGAEGVAQEPPPLGRSQTGCRARWWGGGIELR